MKAATVFESAGDSSAECFHHSDAVRGPESKSLWFKAVA